ncbi:heterokaryon incompatibility protein-domain-containing protein [Dendryphion nanum]|uniref:Heterokaryon incompatibility protein-domain-containing protein n=1 Tax=Dendryphion nanum TaxID=256645 RepID=A0A9P9IKQ5_9PLEO|nr:heterokaryon incompatibility protein-domain-containing protein [Dendryphion nanum]
MSSPQSIAEDWIRHEGVHEEQVVRMKPRTTSTERSSCSIESAPEIPRHESELYIYDPLKLPTLIRLLELCPGQRDDEIHCSLRDVELDDTLHYHALSYVWGSPKDKTHVFCHGKKVKVPSNLCDFLRQLRNAENVRYFWADSICINQSDLKERSQQVKLMTLIYTRAQDVLIWLGKDDPFRDLLTREDVCEAAERLLRFHGSISAIGASKSDSDDTEARFDNWVYSFWTAYGKLTQRDWFSRLWVVQEAGLARTASIFVGSRIIDFQRFLDTNVEIFAYHTYLAARFLIFFPCDTFFVFQERGPGSFGNGAADFLTLLARTEKQDSSDPRDHIFALLGHPSARLNGKYIIEPDYERPYTDIFHEVTIKILQETRNLRILSAGNLSKISDQDTSLPSWVPRWGNFQGRCWGLYQHLRECFYADADISAEFSFAVSNTVLKVRGFTFDIVQDHVGPFKLTPVDTVNMTVDNWLKDIIGFNQTLGVPIREELKSLSECICAFANGTPAEREQSQRDFATFRLKLFQELDESRRTEWMQLLIPEGLEAAKKEARGVASNFNLSAAIQLYERKLFNTKNGSLGNGPLALQTGDVCCVLFENSVPKILRPEGPRYRLVGEAYVNEIMQGQAVVDLILNDKYAEQIFEII